MFDDTADPHSARIILTVCMVTNTLECFDDLGVDLKGPPRKHADGILSILGPAAVFTSILQAAPILQTSERVGGFVDVFVDAATRRRTDLIAALPEPLRGQVLEHETTRSVPPARVIELFQQALEGSRLPAMVQRLSDPDAIERMAERVAGVHERSGESLGPDATTIQNASIPREALSALGGALARAGVDEDALARVLDGVLPPDSPPGYIHDGSGTLVREAPKAGRNDPCPCGSGRKYKKCHGRPGAPPLR